MSTLQEFHLSLVTLLLTFILPFAYYGYRGSFWYLPARLKLLNFLVTLIAIGVILLAAIKGKNALTDKNWDLLLLAILHMLPPLLALTAIWLGKYELMEALKPERPRASKDEFAPKQINESVEKLGWDQLIIGDELKEELLSVVNLLKDPEEAARYGIEVPKGILLSGPPGTGKTTIAKVVANTAGLSFFALRADEIVSKWVGESEKNLSKLFESAQQNAPAVIFIDEVDSLGKKRSDKSASHSDNLLNHLLQLIDGVVKAEGLYIIAATNRPELVDDALKRAGRLTRVIQIPLPDSSAREKLFELYLRNLKLRDDVDIEALAKVTEGSSAADIREICNQAGLHAYRREADKPEKERHYEVTSEDVEAALDDFSKDDEDLSSEEGSSLAAPKPLNQQIEKLSWSDLIIDQSLREELESVVTLLKDPHTATRYGIEVPKGILLNGPPGTGKTTLAKVVANTAGLSFFVLKLDEIISKWVGESEKNLTRLFQAAEKAAPSIIFIDEIDSIGKNRAEGNAQHADNLLNHLLQLIDGVIKQDGVYVFGATNRADLVDPALKRGGRLNKVIEVGLPDALARGKMFELYLSKLTLADKVNFDSLAALTEGKSAADIKAICNQAGLNAFKRESAAGSREFKVKSADLQAALNELLKGTR